MADLSGLPVTEKWPPRNSGILQLCSFPTPNDVKAPTRPAGSSARRRRIAPGSRSGRCSRWAGSVRSLASSDTSTISPGRSSRTSARRSIGEARRLQAVLDGALDGRDWSAGDYHIAIAPRRLALDFYGAGEAVGWTDHGHVVAHVDRFLARPAVQRSRNTRRGTDLR